MRPQAEGMFNKGDLRDSGKALMQALSCNEKELLDISYAYRVFASTDIQSKRSTDEMVEDFVEGYLPTKMDNIPDRVKAVFKGLFSPPGPSSSPSPRNQG